MPTRLSLLSIVTIAFLLILAQPGWTKVEYDSTSLLIKSSDQIGDMVKKKIRQAQVVQSKQEDSEDGDIVAEPEAFEHLKDALRIVLARPDQDGARANLYARIRAELADLNSLEQAMIDLTEEALSELRTQDGPRRTATYVVILENMMAEIRPELKGNPNFRKILERIRDAKISIEDKAKLKNLLRSMSVPVSPSVTAQKILEKEPAAPAATKGK